MKVNCRETQSNKCVQENRIHIDLLQPIDADPHWILDINYTSQVLLRICSSSSELWFSFATVPLAILLSAESAPKTALLNYCKTALAELGESEKFRLLVEEVEKVDKGDFDSNLPSLVSIDNNIGRRDVTVKCHGTKRSLIENSYFAAKIGEPLKTSTVLQVVVDSLLCAAVIVASRIDGMVTENPRLNLVYMELLKPLFQFRATGATTRLKLLQLLHVSIRAVFKTRSEAFSEEVRLILLDIR